MNRRRAAIGQVLVVNKYRYLFNFIGLSATSRQGQRQARAPSSRFASPLPASLEILEAAFMRI